MAKSSLKRISPLSAMIVIGADLVATPQEVGATILLPIIGTVAVGLFYGVVTAILVFLNEFYESKKFGESLLDGLIFGFLVGIPTPIAGIVGGGSQLLLK